LAWWFDFGFARRLGTCPAFVEFKNIACLTGQRKREEMEGNSCRDARQVADELVGRVEYILGGTLATRRIRHEKKNPISSSM
jgi:hypothetical protein